MSPRIIAAASFNTRPRSQGRYGAPLAQSARSDLDGLDRSDFNALATQPMLSPVAGLGLARSARWSHRDRRRRSIAGSRLPSPSRLLLPRVIHNVG